MILFWWGGLKISITFDIFKYMYNWHKQFFMFNAHALGFM